MVYSFRGSIPYHRPKFPLDTFKGASYIKGSARKKKRYFFVKTFSKSCLRCSLFWQNRGVIKWRECSKHTSGRLKKSTNILIVFGVPHQKTRQAHVYYFYITMLWSLSHSLIGNPFFQIFQKKEINHHSQKVRVMFMNDWDKR